jgi:hypothetical protein
VPYLLAIPCGRAGPVGTAVLKSQLEARVRNEVATRHVQHVDLMITLQVNHAERILVQEIVGYDQALVVLRKIYVVWLRGGAKLTTSKTNGFSGSRCPS